MKNKLILLSVLLLCACNSNSNKNNDVHHVTFLNADETVLYEVDVEHKKPAIYKGVEPTKAVTDGRNYEYDFVKWDHDLSSITSSVIIRPEFHMISQDEIIRGNNIYKEMYGKSTKDIIGYEFYQYRPQDDENKFEVPSSYNSKPILRIGKAAFFECSNIEVSLPSTIEVIDEYAFNSCSNLTKVNIPSSVHSIKNAAFYLTTNIKELDLNNVSYIGEDNFFLCSSLEEFKVSSTNSQFAVHNKMLYTKDFITLLRAPDNIESINFHKNLKSFAPEALSRLLRVDEIVIPDSIISLSENLFFEAKIKNVTLNGNYNLLNRNLFRSCNLLENVIINAPIINIEDRVFYQCNSLLNIELPESVETFGEFAFAYCYSLKELNLPTSLKTISYGALDELISLENLSISEANPYYKTIDGNLYSKDETIIYRVCESKKEIALPTSLKVIGSGSFYNCLSIDHIELPNTVEVIEDFAFYNCKKITELYIPDSVISIDHHAFSLMESLTTIHLPTDLTMISESLFDSCESLQNVNIPYNVKIISNYAFANCLSLETLTISKEIESFGKETFASCNALNTINYEGNEEEWNKIKNIDISSLTKETIINYNYAY